MDRHYSPLSRTMHWLGAMAVIVMLTLGFMMFFADSREVKHFSEATHIGVGFFAFLLIGWRSVLRLYQGFPEPAHTLTEKVARYLHYALLLTMLVLIVTGPLYLFTENESLSVFGWFAVSFDLRVIEWIHEPVEEVHKVLGAYILPLLLILHIGGGVRNFYKQRA